MDKCTLICNGSGSSGNSYIIDCGNEKLLIELGVPYPDIITGLDYDLSKVKGILVSHIHGDHLNVGTYNKFLKTGIPIYSCQEVVDKYPSIRIIEHKKLIKIGGFSIQSIPVKHNAENNAFIIKHELFGKLVFATDLSDFLFKIKEVNHWLIEANYSDDVILNNASNNSYSQSASTNHLSIDKTLNILKNNFNFCTQTIVLLHLSDGNSSRSVFIKLVKDELGFSNVFVAEKGLNIELVKSEF